MSQYLMFFDNDYLLLDKEFIKLGEDKAWGVHNPHEATPIKKSEFDQFKKRFKRAKDLKLIKASAAFKSFAETNWVYRPLEYLDPQLNKPFDPNLSIPQIIDQAIKIRMADDNLYTMETYNSWRNGVKFGHLLPSLWQVSSRASSDYKHRWPLLELVFKKDLSFDLFQKDWEIYLQFWDRLRSPVEKEDKIRFNLMTYDLSYSGIMSWEVTRKGDKFHYEVQRNGWIEASFSHLKEIFDHTKKYHYYE